MRGHPARFRKNSRRPFRVATASFMNAGCISMTRSKSCDEPIGTRPKRVSMR
jgi:hypothetical protein